MTDSRLCVLCPVYRPTGDPQPAERPRACGRCRDRLARDLAELLDLASHAADQVERETRADGPKVSTSRELPVPVNLDTLGVWSPPYQRGIRAAGGLDLGGDPAAVLDQIGIPNPAAVLDQWVTDWAEVRQVGERLPVPTHTAITRWLTVRLQWACDVHPAVDEFAAEVRDLVRRLRGMTGEHHQPRGAGRCPQVLRDEKRCGARLDVDAYDPLITCPRCGSRWDRRRGEWRTLRAAQDDVQNGREEAA